MTLKTRIKIVTRNDGEKRYYPQYQFLFMWLHFSSSTEYIVECYYLSKAQEFIDWANKEIEWKNNKKAKSIEYVTYP